MASTSEEISAPPPKEASENPPDEASQSTEQLVGAKAETDLAKTAEGALAVQSKDIETPKDEKPTKSSAIPTICNCPIGALFVILYIGCERFCFYGTRVILALYLKNVLHYEERSATAWIHAFMVLSYFFPLVGAVIADNWFGKFKTIIFFTVIYCIGSVAVTFAAIDISGFPIEAFTIAGLILVSIGVGTIKPCVSSFGGDQFKLPEQEVQLGQYFATFYFSVNVGAFFGMLLVPILRDIPCLDDDSCYSLGFGVATIFGFIAFAFIAGGYIWYKINPPTGNIVVTVVACIFSGLKGRIAACFGEKKDVSHWIEYAHPSYSQTLKNEVRSVLAVLFLFIPLPIFWALFDQNGSTWTYQGNIMDNQLGNWPIPPDIPQSFNPLFVVILVPIFNWLLYPFLKKINFLANPLPKMILGGLLAASSFVAAGILMLFIEAGLPYAPEAGKAHLILVNTQNVPVEFKADCPGGSKLSYVIEPEQTIFLKDLSPARNGICHAATHTDEFDDMSFYLVEKQVYTLWFYADRKIYSPKRDDKYKKPDAGRPSIRVFYSVGNNNKWSYPERSKVERLKINWGKKEKIFNITTADGTVGVTDYIDDVPFLTDVKLQLQEKIPNNPEEFISVGQEQTFVGNNGAIYNLMMVYESSGEIKLTVVSVVDKNYVHIFWQLIQYLLLTAGEVLFSPTGLEFAFTQAPISMKSVVASAWLMTIAIGNVIVMIVSKSRIFRDMSSEFFFYAAMLVLSMLIFGLLCWNYKYVQYIEESKSQIIAKKEGEENRGKDERSEKTEAEVGEEEAEP